MRLAGPALALTLGAALLTGCGTTPDDDAPGSRPVAEPTGQSDSRSPRAPRTPKAAKPQREVKGSSITAEPLPWGPTPSELDRSRDLVATWSAEQLAGQMIVARFDGTDPAEPGRLVRDLHLAGVSVGTANVVDAAQVRAVTQAVTRAVAADGRDFPPVIGVDQEGGIVNHLGSVATDFPPFATAGAAIEADRANGGHRGRDAVRRAAAASAMELRALGFTWVFAPVADVTIGAADPTIGSRAASGDPAIAAAATAAATRGYVDAGLVSTPKHFPGHGGVTADSHEVTPVLRSSLAELRARDLSPFRAAVRAAAPAVMIGHLDVRAIAPGVPATLAAATYTFLRDDLGFAGVAITDSMGMGAVVGRVEPGVRALQSGADLLLMPGDAARTHATVTAAIRTGQLPRRRAEEAAARVAAVQLWQQRRAAEATVPGDAAARAARAAQALSDAGS